MNDIEQRMKRFERRVRLVRSWRGMAIGLCVGAAACGVWAALAASIFLLGNTPILLNADAKKQREELKQAGQAVEKITKPLENPKEQQEMTPQEKRLLDEMRKLSRDLEKAHVDKKEAMEKA